MDINLVYKIHEDKYVYRDTDSGLAFIFNQEILKKVCSYRFDTIEEAEFSRVITVEGQLHYALTIKPKYDISMIDYTRFNKQRAYMAPYHAMSRKYGVLNLHIAGRFSVSEQFGPCFEIIGDRINATHSYIETDSRLVKIDDPILYQKKRDDMIYFVIDAAKYIPLEEEIMI